MTRLSTAIAIILSAVMTSAGPQSQQPTVLPEGTASIMGRVTSADTGKAIPGALVEIIAYNNISKRFRQVTADDEGKFAFTKLPAGQYRLAAQAARYVRMQFGQKEAGPATLLNPDRAIEVSADQAFTQADFALSGYVAIEGTVLDEFGDPAPNVSVQVSQLQFVAGRRRLLPASPSPDAGAPRLTDDLGRFRIGGLIPGDYYVEALSGAFADAKAAGGFAVTFFPGTSNASEAGKLTIRPGHDVTDVVFALKPAASAHLSGVVIDDNGQPLRGGSLMLMPSERAGAALAAVVRATIDQNGKFAFQGVPPGIYTIQAFGAAAGADRSAANAFGYLTFTVDGRDLDTLIVKVPAPRTIRGHISFDGDMTRLPRNGSDVLISLRQINFESAPIAGGPAPTAIRDDWTFEVSGMSGLRMVTVTARQGWILKRAMLNGQDVTDSPLDLRENDVNGLELSLTTRMSNVVGTIVDMANKPVTDAGVVIFADDESKWTVWSRYIVSIRSDDKGTFTVKGLPAANYVAVPVPSLLNGEWQDPEFLRKLKTSGDAVRFALTEEANETIKVMWRK